MRITLLTSDGLRHRYLGKLLIDRGHEVQFLAEPKYKDASAAPGDWEQTHFNLLDEALVDLLPSDVKLETESKKLERGCFKDDQCIADIETFNPEAIITYGCGIVGDDILARFDGKVFGSHQGLPQYYRGSGSNMFAVLEGFASYVGISFHVLDRGIDTGGVIAQRVVIPTESDNYYSLSAKLIMDTIEGYADLADAGFSMSVKELPQLGRLFQRSDFNDQTLRKLWSLLLTNSMKDLFDRSVSEHGMPKLVGVKN